MIRRILPTIGRSLLDLWDNILVLSFANATWALSAMPGLLLFLVGGGGFLLGLLSIAILVLTLGPTTAALFYVTADVTRRERLELREFFRGIRRFYRRGWVAAAINGVFALLAYFNLAFYSSRDLAGSPLALLFIVWLYFIFVWFSLQVYMWPLILRMEELKIGLLMRNSVLATFKYPFFTLGLCFFLLVLLVLSYFTAFVVYVLFGMALHALICNKALSAVLEQERARNVPADGPTALDVPPPPEKIKDVPPEEVESVPVPTVNTPTGVKRRSPSIAQNAEPKTDKKTR